MSKMLKKRTWVYLQRPRVYGISGCKCGNDDPEWSEYEKHLWCEKCQLDFIPEEDGVFGGPILVNTAQLMGLCFDRYNLKTERIEKFEELMNLNEYAREVHKSNDRWWKDLKTGQPLDRNFGELIALCHSELSEALEGDRKDLMDDKLPHRKQAEVELVDCLIRIFDIAGARGYDLEGAYQEKMAYNANREDHKAENRLKPGGKAY